MSLLRVCGVFFLALLGCRVSSVLSSKRKNGSWWQALGNSTMYQLKAQYYKNIFLKK